MKQIFTLLLLAFFSFSSNIYGEELKANFSAKETEKEIYRQGFDTVEDLSDWSFFVTNRSNTWVLNNPRAISDFSTIESESSYSLYIAYDSRNVQNEEARSPVFEIKETSTLHFYAAFDGVFAMYAPLTVDVEDQATSTRTTIFNSFLWSQESGHERPKWLRFSFDLADYAGKNVKIIFKYQGVDGDFAAIDGFRITEKDDSETAKVTIQEGKKVNFQDSSKGNPTEWEWTFEGGTPATSTEQNPVVTYNVAGTYNVTLKIKEGANSDEVTRTDFIIVQGVAPVALFDFPTQGYLSPDAAIFVPLNVPVTYTDKSENVPTEWKWTLPGTENTVYTEQNPTVIYTTEGTYDAALSVKNNQGTDLMDFVKAVKAGGSCHIWNITMDESQTIGAISLGFYGYYGGSNFMDIYAFAERYEAPLTEASIDEVDIYFAYTKTILEPVDIKVYLTTEKDGLPGDTLATSVLSTSELKYDPEGWLPTTFKFDAPIKINEPFFIIVDGIPSRVDESTDEADDVAMGAIRRDFDSPRGSTVYHYGPNWDAPAQESVWLKNTDDNFSFGITPKLTYKTIDTGIEKEKSNIQKPVVYINNGQLIVKNIESVYSAKVYSITGVELKSFNNINSNNVLDIPFANGVYIVRIQKGDSSWSFKINL